MTLKEIRQMSTEEIQHELAHIVSAYQTCETAYETHYTERSEKNLTKVLAERTGKQATR